MNPFSRRTLLGGLGAGFVPLFSSSSAKGAPAFPKRVIVIQWTNGVIANSFFPTGGETDFVLPDVTSPLEPFRKDIIIPQGLGLKVQQDDKGGAAGNPFSGYGGHASLPYLLTGAPSAVGTADGGPYPVGNALSVDQHIANAIGDKTPIKSLELGGVSLDGKDGMRSMSFRGPAIGSPARPQDNRPEVNPAKVFARIMGVGGKAPVDDAALMRLRLERKSILDAVLGDLSTMRRRLPSVDKAKLDGHAAFIRQLEGELNQAKVASCATLGAAPVGFLGNAADGKRFDKVIKAQMDLIITSLRCDITRVATLMMYGPHNNLVSFPFLGSEFEGPAQHKDTGSAPGDFISHHEIAHNSGQNDADPDRKRKNRSDKWHMEMLAYLVAEMKKIPEGPGANDTMLDNTVILMANNMGNGGAHSVTSLPWVLAGRCGGYFKTGRFLKAGSGSTPHNGVLVALCNAMDVPPPMMGGAPYFGDPRYGGELGGLKA